MKFNDLNIKHKLLFDRFLHLGRHELSAHAFANIFIWKDLFRIFWVILEDNLCVFLQDDFGTFMYLPPLGKRQSRALVDSCFQIMDDLNPNQQFSRIENVEEKDLDLYRGFGYKIVLKSNDYVYRRDELALLAGNRFKSKRWAYNYFIKHYRFYYHPFAVEDHRHQCLNLCCRWMDNRQKISDDSVYQYMLNDSFSCQRVALKQYEELSLLGRLVKVNGKITGYTFGFELNKDTFCVLFEVTDNSTQGISQFIFRELSLELKDYKYINIMDDSGLENLKKVKLSYHPCRLVPNYIIRRR